MPRNGRIRLVGKRENREQEARADELRELERELRRERRAQQLTRRRERRAGDAAEADERAD